jgi:predicted nucleic acid-binding protein
MTRTFLDSGALIAAVRRDPAFEDRIDRLILDPDRLFVSSVFVRLEVLPKPVYHKQPRQVTWLEQFFRSLVGWVDASPGLTAQAENIARRHGLSALDALHVAAAIAPGADELITTERPTKPLHRARGVRVVAL